MSLAELKAAAQAATPGLWGTGKDGATGLLAPYASRPESWVSVICCSEEDCGEDVKANINPADLLFIVLSNPTIILKLIAVAEAAHDVVESRVPFCEGDFAELEAALKELET